MKLSELAKCLNAQIVIPEGSDVDLDLLLRGVAPIDHAREGDVTFLSNLNFEKSLQTTGASVVITRSILESCKKPQIIHVNPVLAFAKTAQLFYQPKHESRSVSEKAFIDESVKLGESVTIYPMAYVGKKASIGSRSTIYPGVYVGDDAVIGEDTILFPNVVIGDQCQVGSRVIIHGGTVIGGDGFGFVPGELEPGKKEIVKIPQTGIVVLEDDVEVGAGSTIDRATMGVTRIGKGTKIDSSVHVAHNVQIGQNCFICGQAGIAGSAKIGNWVVLAGHSGVADHIEIGDGVTLGGMGGFTKNTLTPGEYMGFPAMPARDWKRLQAYIRNLPRYEERLKKIEEHVIRSSKKRNPY